MSNIQLKGAAKLAPTGDTLVDYSNQISSLSIVKSRNSVTEPATLGTGRESEKAGTKSEQLVITFFSDMAAASMWAELYDIIDSDDAILDFESTLNPGPVGVDNPSFAGSATLMNLETGADVGTLRQQTITLPITAAGVVKTTA